MEAAPDTAQDKIEAPPAQRNGLDPQTRDFYRRCLRILVETRVPFLVGGAYALEQYTGISRHTKDFDVFLRKEDLDRALEALSAAGYRTEVTAEHWLAKVLAGEDVFVDLIFASGNGVSTVDDSWFNVAPEHEVLGIPARLVSPEDMVLTKAFVMERERYDGADIAHLLKACASEIDWKRLTERFGSYWRVLLSHLILFGFVYPGERDLIPGQAMRNLLEQLSEEMNQAPAQERLCEGTLISREQYLIDVQQWRYEDGRLRPRGNLTPENVAQMTDDIKNKDKYKVR